MSISIFTIVKYTAACFSAAYGLYATINDFHEEHGGRKVLSRKGYLGICLLGISSVLSVSTDGWKDARDIREKALADQKGEKARKELSNTLTLQLQQTKSILEDVQEQRRKTREIVFGLENSLSLERHNTDTAAKILAQTERTAERTVRPLKELPYFFSYELPRNNRDVQQYLERITPQLDSLLVKLKNGQKVPGVTLSHNPSTAKTFLHISAESDLFPNDREELVVLVAITGATLRFEFYVNAKDFQRDTIQADLDFRIGEIGGRGRDLSYELSDQIISVSPFGTIALDDPDDSTSNRRIVSVTDLEQSWVLFSFTDISFLKTEEQSKRLRSLMQETTLELVQFESYNGTHLVRNPKARKGGHPVLPRLGGLFKTLFHLT